MANNNLSVVSCRRRLPAKEAILPPCMYGWMANINILGKCIKVSKRLLFLVALSIHWGNIHIYLGLKDLESEQSTFETEARLHFTAFLDWLAQFLFLL